MELDTGEAALHWWQDTSRWEFFVTVLFFREFYIQIVNEVSWLKTVASTRKLERVNVIVVTYGNMRWISFRYYSIFYSIFKQVFFHILLCIYGSPITVQPVQNTTCNQKPPGMENYVVHFLMTHVKNSIFHFHQKTTCLKRQRFALPYGSVWCQVWLAIFS